LSPLPEKLKTIQLDDLSTEQLARVRDATFMIIARRVAARLEVVDGFSVFVEIFVIQSGFQAPLPGPTGPGTSSCGGRRGLGAKESAC
jgi:hypothetical protein